MQLQKRFSLQTDFLKHSFHLPLVFMAYLFLIQAAVCRCADIRQMQERP